MTAQQFNRAMGAMAGVALGDAMGMPSQTMTRDQIRAAYGVIDGLVAAAAGQPVSHGLAAGTITDDTEQTILLARHLIARQGRVDDQAWAEALLDWERDVQARGVNDLLGPSTKRAIAALLSGVPASEAGRFGTTNGAAMRISPVALATPAEPLAHLVAKVTESCRLTHNTPTAIAAASAVAAVISLGVDGASFDEAVPQALRAARLAEPAITERIRAALDGAAGKSGLDAAQALAATVGTSVASAESIPMAFAIVRMADGDPWATAVLSANIGDDTDTIGAISCAMAGACAGFAAFPAREWQQVAAVNRLDLEPLVRGLLAIRTARAGGWEKAS